MSESGRSCRRSDRRAPAELTIEVVRGDVIVERQGRQWILPADDDVRRALEAGDDTALERLVARKLPRNFLK